jgi:hypothetical protein
MRLFTAAAVILGGGGILGFLLSGCFSPAAADLPPENPVWNVNRANTWQEPDPFEVKVWIGGEGEKRNAVRRGIVGPGGWQLIKGEYSIRSFAQLVVTDDKGNIIEVVEDRRTDAGSSTELVVENITFDNTYNFLLLMGHWERNYAGEKENPGQYQYKDGPPTLLAAGFKSQTVTAKNSLITIAMYPIQVDTKFTTGGGSGKVEPFMVDGNPREVFLYAANTWKFAWTVKGEGARSALLDAQNTAASSRNGTALKFKRRRSTVETTKKASPEKPSSKSEGDSGGEWSWDSAGGEILVQQDIGQAASGDTGWGYFNLEYVPFGMLSKGDWAKFKEAAPDYQGFYDTDGVPVWIIRSGVNDAKQDDRTRFIWDNPSAAAMEKWDGTANGNGGVRFKATSTEVNIVTSQMFSYYVNPTKGQDTDAGSNPNRGSVTEPFQTVEAALTKLGEDYGIWKSVADSISIDAGDELAAWGEIVIEGAAEIEGNQIVITGPRQNSSAAQERRISEFIYPPITFRGGGSGGTLKLTGQGSLITVGADGKVTLYGSIALEGMGPETSNNAALVTVKDGGKFSLSGAVIRDNWYTEKKADSGPWQGGGVSIESGNFTMTGGAITENGVKFNNGTPLVYGGGVYVGPGAVFTMEGGEISKNGATSGGGVYVEPGAVFTKTYTTGIISGLKWNEIDEKGNIDYSQNSETNTLTRNALANNGVAVGGSVIRITTAGKTDSLDSGKPGAGGGWESWSSR